MDIDYLEEALGESIDCLKTGEKLSAESIKELAKSLLIDIDCYQELYCGHIENPLDYQMKELERKHKGEIEAKERELDNRMRSKNDVIGDRNRSIDRLRDKLEEARER